MPPVTKEMLESRAEAIRTGGPGTMRRKVKNVHKSAGGDSDKKVQNTLKRLGVAPAGDVDEVSFYKGDGSMYLFKNPKLQASVHSGCFVVSGNYETKPIDMSAFGSQLEELQAKLAAMQASAGAAAEE